MRSAVYRLAAILLVARGAVAFAMTVGVSPAQDPAVADPAPMGDLVSGCLGALFDAGFIATDAACASLSRADWEDPAFGISEAKEGRIDFVVALFASWKESAFKKGASLPSSASYRLVRVADGALVAQGSLEGPVDSEEAALSAPRAAEAIGASIGAACVAALESRSPGGNP